ncbi:MULTISPECIES: hypothetical protein [unclassified Moraxella]|uniref:hypothetical protein n=1 Tax=unclassified Moraxella TaxID=2685852 RepID=UPI003AF531EF
MRYIFLALLALNVLTFGYYSYVHKDKPSQSYVIAKAELTNPVNATNVSSELPPMIGTKK